MKGNPRMVFTREALIAHIDQGNDVEYLFFWLQSKKKDILGADCFSQWYQAPFTVNDILYRTAEHYMMAQKARLFGDEEIHAKILASTSARAVKELGRQIKNFDQPVWEQHRFNIVVVGNKAKFSQHDQLKAFLLSTGSKIIVETSPLDPVWGIGLAEDDPAAQDPRQWKGLNLLGFALMQVREGL